MRYQHWHFHAPNLSRVGSYLSAWCFSRVVSSGGQISFLAKRYSGFSAHKARSVCIRFDATDWLWKVYDNKGDFIAHWSAEGITADRIKRLTVFQRTAT